MGRHSATSVASASKPRRRPASWFTKLRAVLAGALVLGVGAAVTVAAWNDSEFAQGTFSASTFGIVGATNGVDFSEHPDAASAAALTFTAPFDAMSPGSTAYAAYSVQTTADSTVGGTVALSAASGNSTGLGQWLTYSVRTIAGADCNATTFAGGESVATDGTATRTLSSGGSDQVNYCFAITLPAGTPNEAQGTSVDASWTFTATSSS
ncbi:SipW-dependent-type signal peptide-containing protein [Paramicrobacterium chengjingii]|uniref:SipW-dependent-type signal peptide-containing protein n=1 Tax=Paramicrobacterium chengjingii TaxID=2769067 RepID=UPI00141E96A0|nr:SipW-dependent-type signal peptide-containing protein [Microbacterium chengjingii]